VEGIRIIWVDGCAAADALGYIVYVYYNILLTMSENLFYYILSKYLIHYKIRLLYIIDAVFFILTAIIRSIYDREYFFKKYSGNFILMLFRK